MGAAGWASRRVGTGGADEACERVLVPVKQSPVAQCGRHGSRAVNCEPADVSAFIGGEPRTVAAGKV
jgi:hypothetical protein